MSAPRLNLHSKSRFLIHQGNKMSSASDFFKCLVISRQFLQASQMYRVYEVKIIEFCDNNKFNICIAMVGHKANATEKFHLTLEQLRHLNNVLNIQYMDIFKYCYNNANEYLAISKIFKEHISLCLCFDRKENQIHHYSIIKEVQNQLYSLRCYAKSLIDSPKVPRLDLIFCGVGTIENFYQIKQVLSNHRIRKLTIDNSYRDSDPRFDETIDDNYFADFPLCSRIRKLDFRWSQLDETHELVSKLTKMVSFFPNLTNMDCDFDAQYYISEKFGLQDLINRMTIECGKIKQLQRACPPTASIKLIYTFQIRRPESLKTVKQMIKHMLKKTNFNQLKLFKHFVEEDVVSAIYQTVVVWKESNFYVILYLEGSLNLLTLEDNEEIEDDDNLLITSFS